MLETPAARELKCPVAGRPREDGIPLERGCSDRVALAIMGGEKPLFEILARAKASLQDRADRD